MSRTTTAVFDGEALRPDIVLGLTPNTRYRITVDAIPTSTQEEDAWTVLDRLSGTIEAPPDWSREHDHYLYHSPRRNSPG